MGTGHRRFCDNDCIASCRQVKRPNKAPPAAEAERKSDLELREDDPPFQVMASIKDDGLGLAIWWGGGQAEEVQEGEGESGGGEEMDES